MTNIKVPKGSEKYVCETCDYITCRESQYNRHLSTPKHQIRKNTNENVPKSSTEYACNCGKKYKHSSSLWNHQQKCKPPIKDASNNYIVDKDLVMLLIKENSELKTMMIDTQNQMLEVIKTGTHNTTNNTNSHNKTFNLQFFLNETCKNAMNINEFVDSIKLQISDLENVGKIGYVEGLSKIIIKNLNALDVTERPVHCSDSKRDTMYVKDEDKWEKENEDNHKVLKAIEDIANKNSKMVKEWKTKNPECASSKSHKADVYSHIMIEAVCSNNDTNNNKILKKIAKEITIDKN